MISRERGDDRAALPVAEVPHVLEVQGASREAPKLESSSIHAAVHLLIVARSVVLSVPLDAWTASSRIRVRLAVVSPSAPSAV